MQQGSWSPSATQWSFGPLPKTGSYELHLWLAPDPGHRDALIRSIGQFRRTVARRGNPHENLQSDVQVCKQPTEETRLPTVRTCMEVAARVRYCKPTMPLEFSSSTACK